MANLKDLIVNGSARILGTLYADLSGNATTATTATKLGSSTVGGTTTPIYLNAGVPTALSFTIAKSVPADAKFTDTTYTAGTNVSITNGTISATSTSTYSATGTVPVNGTAVASALSTMSLKGTYDSATETLTLSL